MSRNPDRLLRHLITAVVVKLAVLMLLWWVFVREAPPPVDAEQAAAHLGRGTTSGEKR